MTAERGAVLAAQIRAIIRATGEDTPRSQQSSANKLGMSDIGQCRSMLTRMIAHHDREPRESIKFAAFIGTAVGDLLERRWPGRSQVPVQVKLPNGMAVRGTADLVDDHDGAVVDLKTTNHLALVRAQPEPAFEHQAQIAGYLVGLVQAGDLEEDAIAALVYLDRSGADEQPHVVTYTYDQALAILDRVVARFEDIAYALAHGVEHAPRDKPVEWCQAACPFLTACRGFAPDGTEGLLDDPETLSAVDLYLQGKAQEKAGAALAKQARQVLVGTSGSTGSHSVYWTHYDAIETKATVRAAHDRLTIRPIKAE